MVKTKIGRFECKRWSNNDIFLYFTFNKKDYESMTYLLETASVHQGLNRSLSQIHIPGLSTPDYNENKDIFELHSGAGDSKLYHIGDCTVQIFTNFPTDNKLAGIIIANLDKDKRQETLETLEKILE